MAKSNEKSTNYYIAEDEKTIKDKISETARKTAINESTDLVSAMTSLFDSNIMLGVYDLKTKERINKKEELKYLANIGIKEEHHKPFSDKAIDDYLKLLEIKLEEDISNCSGEQVLALITDNNVAFFQYYATKIQPNLFDLFNEETQTTYALKVLNYLMELQQVEIDKIGYKEFSNLDLDNEDSNFTRYFSIQTLKILQEDIKNSFNDKTKKPNLDTIKENVYNSLFTETMNKEQEKIDTRIKEEVKNNYEFYKNRHNKFLRIKELLQALKEKYENRLNEIAESNKISNSEKELYKNIITDNFQIIDNRLHKNLAYIESNIEQPVDLKLVNEKEKGIKTTPVNILLDISDISLYGNYLDEFDLSILDIAFNLYQAGNRHLTPELVYKEFTGKTPNNIGKELYKSILNSIYKLSSTKIRIIIADETKKALKWDNELVKRLSYIEDALPLRQIEIEYTNHTKKMCFMYYSEEPIYFLFSRSIGQIKTLDRRLLALDTGSSLNKDRIIMRIYLAREFKRIESTIGTKLQNNKISYDSFFKKCGIFKALDEEIKNESDPNAIKKLKNKKKTYKNRYIKEVIKEVLEYWKKEGFIKDYKEYTSKTNGRGIELIGVKKLNSQKALK